MKFLTLISRILSEASNFLCVLCVLGERVVEGEEARDVGGS